MRRLAALLAAAAPALAQAPTPAFNAIRRPAADERIAAGSTLAVAWDTPAAYARGAVAIQLIGGDSQQTQVPLANITDGVPSAAGEFAWLVPDSLGDKNVYGLVMRWLEDPSVFQYSNPFHITAADVSPSAPSASASSPSASPPQTSAVKPPAADEASSATDQPSAKPPVATAQQPASAPVTTAGCRSGCGPSSGSGSGTSAEPLSSLRAAESTPPPRPTATTAPVAVQAAAASSLLRVDALGLLGALVAVVAAAGAAAVAT